jgi:hypothetical protein
MENTQLQIRFESVPASLLFPNGCKVQYRAYDSPRVVEITKQPKGSCITPIGQLTGLEARTVYCKWYPSSDNSIPGREGVEGISFLTSLPSVDANSGFTIPPLPFADEAAEAFEGFLQEVYKTYLGEDRVRIAWQKWVSTEGPVKCTAEEYALTYDYIPPLIDFFIDGVEHEPNWSMDFQKDILQSEDIPWPAELAGCLPSVKTRYDRNPPPPRFFATKDKRLATLIETFKEKTNRYYDVVLDGVNRDVIKDLLLRRIDTTGTIPSSTGGEKN